MTGAVLLGMVAAIAAATTGMVLVRGPARMTGWLLILASLALACALVRPPTGAVPFALSLLVAGLASVAVAAAGASWPVIPPSTGRRRLILWIVATTFLVGGLLPALLSDPRAAGCFECPANLVRVVTANPPAETLRHLADAWTLIWAPVLVVLSLDGTRRAPALTRRHSWPIVGAGVAAAIAGAGEAVGALTSPVENPDPLGSWTWWVLCGAMLLMAGGVATRAYLVRTAQRRMARTALAAFNESDDVVASLRTAVGDSSLEVVYLREDGTALDRKGNPEPDLAVAASSMRLNRNHVPFAEVRFDPRLVGSADLVRAAVTSASLTLEHTSTHARLRAAIAERTALRARIVVQGDAERRRLERNLHDGAQQQLIALGLTIAAMGPGEDHLAAHREIDLALKELREIARGLFPASLAEDGLEAALRELGDHTKCALIVTGSLERPIPPEAGPAIYQLVRDTSSAVPPGGSVSVSLTGGGSTAARVELTTSPPVPDADGVTQPAYDRYAAVGGHVAIASDGRATRIEGSLPCGS